MTITEADKKTVRERAGNCCEYCRLSEASQTVPFHIDHFIPKKHDGEDDTDNLCLACVKCNTHKSHDLTGFDPMTGDITPLFNPRQQDWDDHFEVQSDMKILGLTSNGRTRVRVLRMNDEDRVENRQILHTLNDYPCEKS